MEIKLTKQESELYFYNALCNGLDYVTGYGLTIDFKKTDYQKALDNFKKTNPEERPCFEDVLMQILRDGKSITLIDEECDGEYTRTIKMKDVHDRVQKTKTNHLINMINEEDDAETADVIIQSVFFEDIIFG